MTNEEKAREIAEKEVHPIIAERCALEMAEWKDAQFKEYLEQRKERMVKKWGNLVAAEVSTLDMVINEFFKED